MGYFLKGKTERMFTEINIQQTCYIQWVMVSLTGQWILSVIFKEGDKFKLYFRV